MIAASAPAPNASADQGAVEKQGDADASKTPAKEGDKKKEDADQGAEKKPEGADASKTPANEGAEAEGVTVTQGTTKTTDASANIIEIDSLDLSSPTPLIVSAGNNVLVVFITTNVNFLKEHNITALSIKQNNSTLYFWLDAEMNPQTHLKKTVSGKDIEFTYKGMGAYILGMQVVDPTTKTFKIVAQGNQEDMGKLFTNKDISEALKTLGKSHTAAFKNYTAYKSTSVSSTEFATTFAKKGKSGASGAEGDKKDAAGAKDPKADAAGAKDPKTPSPGAKGAENAGTEGKKTPSSS